MSTALVPAISWPMLQFGPVNLWSLPAAWKRDVVPALTHVPVPKAPVAHQVNPQIRRILANR